jgi:hypothetical protein
MRVANKHMDNNLSAIQQDGSCIDNQTGSFEYLFVTDSMCYTTSNLWLTNTHVVHISEVTNTMPNCRLGENEK